MNKKYDKKEVFQYLDRGMSNGEIKELTGMSQAILSIYKKEWKNGTSYTSKEKEEVHNMSDNSKLQESIEESRKLEPMVLNAIYRSSKWQTVFFKRDYLNYFTGEDKTNKMIYDFLKWAVEKVGYMPSQERITLMFDDSVKKRATSYPKEELENLKDLFNDVVWNLEEDADYLDEVCEKYIARQESALLIDEVRMFLVENAPIKRLKDTITLFGKKIDVEDCCVYDMSSDIVDGKVSQYYPFFIPEIEEKIHGLATGNNVLCGCTGSGKTMAAINQEVFLAKQQIASLHFILGDLTALEYQCRILSHLSQIEYFKIIKNADLQKELRTRYRETLKYITVYQSDCGKTIDLYLRECDKIRKRCAIERKAIPSFVVFDYDDLIDTKASEEWKKAEEIYVTTQHYGVKNDVCILLIAQPTKEAEMTIRQGTRKMLLTDISGGRRKANAVANAIGLSVGKKVEGADLVPVTCEVLKGRSGGIGQKVDLFFDGNRCTYVVGDPTNDQFKGFEAKEEEDPCGWKL